MIQNQGKLNVLIELVESLTQFSLDIIQHEHNNNWEDFRTSYKYLKYLSIFGQ